MKKGIMRRAPFSVNIDRGTNFFINPPRGGRPLRDRRDSVNNVDLVGFSFIFLREDSL